MPTYLYCCENCSIEFEEVHSIKEKLEECPHCKNAGKGSHKVTRLISGGSGFILNGDCWAKDRYSK